MNRLRVLTALAAAVLAAAFPLCANAGGHMTRRGSADPVGLSCDKRVTNRGARSSAGMVDGPVAMCCLLTLGTRAHQIGHSSKSGSIGRN